MVDTGEWDVVYNLRVADFHTYFVGCEEWGFSVWAHNAPCAFEIREFNGKWAVFERGKNTPLTDALEYGQAEQMMNLIEENIGSKVGRKPVGGSALWRQRLEYLEGELAKWKAVVKTFEDLGLDPGVHAERVSNLILEIADHYKMKNTYK